MVVVSSKEFRDNQRKYLDIVDNNQQVIIHRGKGKAYILTPVGEKDQYFMDPRALNDIKEGISQYKAGNVTKIDNSDFDNLLGL